MKRLLAAALAAVALMWSTPAASHGGGLDASGCHTNRKTGSYHCHGGSSASASPSRTKYSAPTSSSSSTKRKRSTSARSAFRRNHPCPSTGRTTGSCAGYEVDHVVPLACGGGDTASNMQWLTKEANRSKGAMGCGR
jgi:5-methylcytosine-specific restriction endonuclease McrA